MGTMAPNELRTDERAGVKSLDTAFEILETIQRLDEPGVTRIAEEVGVAKSTVFDHLATLRSRDFAVESGEGYRIGLRFLDFGGRARRNLDLYETAKPQIDKLAAETGELVNLTVEERGMGVYVYFVEGEEAVKLDTYVGKREHLHCTAFGKAILAHLPEERVEAIVEHRGLEPGTDRTIDSVTALQERLDVVRERGYAVDREERLNRLCCVAAPVTSDDGDILGAVSISGPRSRFEDDRLSGELADEVTRTSNIIEINITYS